MGSNGGIEWWDLGIGGLGVVEINGWGSRNSAGTRLWSRI